MRPEHRQTVVNAVLLVTAFAIVTAIIFMRPATRMTRPGPAAQSAALSPVAPQVPGNR